MKSKVNKALRWPFIFACLSSLLFVMDFIPITAQSSLWAQTSDWLRTARMATPWDDPDAGDWEDGVSRAVADGANVILCWADFSDTYQGRVLDPGPGLAELQSRAQYVHTNFPDVHLIVYIAPLEMGTPDSDLDMDGVDDDGQGSAYTDHPDWLQMGVDGRLAVFYGSMPGMPFWVDSTDEDVWLNPDAPEYHDLIMNLAGQIAATGVDGVWFDVPFLRTNFGDGWTNQWATVDSVSRARFQTETGHSLPEPPIAPDWDDPGWQAFIGWRYTQTIRFIADFDAALKGVNPECRLIIETSVGPEVSMTQTGSSSLDLPYVCNATAHEFGGPRTAGKYYLWPAMLATLRFWGDLDRGHPPWLLSYVEKGQPNTIDVARLHAASVVAAGFHYYTSGEEGMTSTPDLDFRRQFFTWLANYDETYYDAGWEPYAEVALIFSGQTMDYLDRGSWDSNYAYHDAWRGMAMLLLESNIPYRVMSDTDLDSLTAFRAVVAPLFGCMSSPQVTALRDYVASGGVLLATGQTSLFDERGQELSNFQLSDVFGVSYDNAEEGEVYVNTFGSGRSVYTLDVPGRNYFWAAAPYWEGGDPLEAEAIRQSFLNDLWDQIGVEPLLSVNVPHGVVALPFRRATGLQVRLVNYSGVGQGDAVPTPRSVTLTTTLPQAGAVTTSQKLDFLGNWSSQSYHQPDPTTVTVTFNLNVHSALFFEQAQTTRYYVSPNGDDANPGAFDQPWRHINYAAGVVGPGDTVYVRSGTYYEYIDSANPGSNGQPILLSVYSGDTVYIDGTSVEWSTGISLPSHYRFLGFKVRNWNAGIMLYGSEDVVVENCEVFECTYGIGATDGAHNFTLQDVDIHDFDLYGFDASSWGGGPVCYDGTFNDCIARDCRDPEQNVDGFAFGDGHGFQFLGCETYNVYDGFDIKADTVTLDRCSAHNCFNGGYKLWGDQLVLTNCLGYNNGVNNVELDWSGTPGHVTLRNCTFAGGETYNILVENPNDHLSMYNCIVAAGQNNGLTFQETGLDQYDGDYNLLHNFNGGDRAINYAWVTEYSLDDLADGDWFAFSGQDEHSLVSYDPDEDLFVDLSQWNLHLREGAIAIDQGTSENGPPVDYEGVSRPQGAGYDIGAYEYAEPTKGDVNLDGEINVLDVVRAVNIILGLPEEPSGYELWAADMNEDGEVNIVDVVLIVQIILGERG
ncbi:MAG: right-handed parallel beta-helix repeat-containing protein [bacterium]